MRVQVERGREGAADVRLSEDVTVDETRRLHRLFGLLSEDRSIRRVALDFAGVGRVDSAGVVTIWHGQKKLERAHKPCTLRNLSEEHRAAFRALPEQPAPAEPPPRPGALERVGSWALALARGVADLAEIVRGTAVAIVRVALRRQKLPSGSLVEQAVVIGVDAALIVLLLGLLIGLILAFQAGYQLRTFGAEIYMAEIVGLGMVREFGPIITAVILAGRSGAAMAAELGTMTVNEEVDALETMGIDPVAFLVLPRVAAITFVQPLLSLMSMAVGTAGGIGVAQLVNVPPRAVYFRMQESLGLGDFWLGLFKSLLFAWIIGFTCCFMGLRTSGGAHGVGRTTTRAVVMSIVLIVVVDSVVTTIWTLSYA